MAPDDILHVIETYEYDYLGNRTNKKTGDITFDYTVDLSSGYSQVLKATNGTDTIYYTRGFELISRREGDVASFYLYDGGLSARALTDEAGAVTDVLVFDAFGNETEKTGTTANSYGFQGEEQDVTGLYYLRARYMDPASGTFTSMDTYAGSLSDPIFLNKYLFANSNPVMYSDPSGHMSREEQITAVSIWAILSNALSPVVSTIASFLGSEFAKALAVIISASMISLILLHFNMGLSTTADDVGSIIINDSIPQEVTEAFREKIRKALEKSREIVQKFGIRKAKSEKELHHIVAKKSLRFHDAHLSRVILSKSGYYKAFALDNADVDDPVNLVYIKTSLHRRLHSYEYHAYVYNMLNSVFDPLKTGDENKKPITKKLGIIAAQLQALSELFPDVMVAI